jgi:hypothetical protein
MGDGTFEHFVADDLALSTGTRHFDKTGCIYLQISILHILATFMPADKMPDNPGEPQLFHGMHGGALPMFFLATDGLPGSWQGTREALITIKCLE